MSVRARLDAVRTASPRDQLRRLRALVPTENGVTVFDAETQETSYGILVEEGLPFIFDTHRKAGTFVATVEALTEVVRPVDVSPRRLKSFGEDAERLGFLAIPYTGCFFKGNLHVYSFSGPIRGLDLSAVGENVQAAERTLREGFRTAWKRTPDEIRRAQRVLLAGRRRARYPADLKVLRARMG